MLRQRAVEVSFEGALLFVASIEDLIAMKRAAGRPKDLGHIAELETLQKLRGETPDN